MHLVLTLQLLCLVEAERDIFGHDERKVVDADIGLVGHVADEANVADERRLSGQHAQCVAGRNALGQAQLLFGRLHQAAQLYRHVLHLIRVAVHVGRVDAALVECVHVYDFA